MFLLIELWMYTINELLKYLSCFNYSVNVVHFRLQWDYYIRGHNSNITWEWRKTTWQYNEALLWCLDLLYGIRGRDHWFLEKGTYKLFVIRWYHWNKAIQVWLKCLDIIVVHVFKSLLLTRICIWEKYICTVFVLQVIKVEWKNKRMRETCFVFLFDNFKSSYLMWLLPTFDKAGDIYNPRLGKYM